MGQIYHAIAVRLYVEQFLNRAFTKVHLPKLVIARAALIEQQRLDGAGVTVEVTRLRITAGPASRLKIVQVQMVPFANTTNGVAAVIGSPHIMAFLTEQNMIARGDHLAGFG